MWYIHIKPLPYLIRTDPDVVEDVLTCAANTALMTRPIYNLRSASSADQNDYIETIFAGFELSAVYCQAPLNY